MVTEGKKSGNSKIQYSILLPTYNESENLPIIIWLIAQYLRFVLKFNSCTAV